MCIIIYQSNWVCTPLYILISKEELNVREMAIVDLIDAIDPIQGADKIELLSVGGWKVVALKGLHSVGDKVIYCEIDAFIPEAIAPFLTKGAPKCYNGVFGNVLRTIKLRGQYSQGLVIPLGEYTGEIGQDLSETLGITKYEKPLPEHLGGLARGNFPSYIKKTDQERVQNIFRKGVIQGKDYQVEEKVDGSSMTVGYYDGEGVVCSRNLSLKLEQEGNSFINAANAANALEVLCKYGKNIALQGELVSGFIQGGRYHQDPRWYIFDVYSIDKQEYLTPSKRQLVLDDLTALGLKAYKAPILGLETIPESISLESLLSKASGKSRINPNIQREGLVYKALDSSITFKVISNEWLLKNE